MVKPWPWTTSTLGRTRTERSEGPVRKGRPFVALALLLVLSACGDDESRAQVPPTLRDAQPAAKDVKVDECDFAPGEQSVSGHVTNGGDRAFDYVIQVGWTDNGLESHGGGFAVVEQLAPGKSADWTVNATITAGATQCIPVVLRGVLPTLPD